MPDLLRQALILFPVGVAVGFVGSLIGVGGGFFVVPFLLFFLPDFTPETATAASLGIVFLSALSATAGNVPRKRIDYRTGAWLAVGTLPGAWFGRVAIGRLTDRQFSIAFGGLLIAIALYLAFVRLKAGKGLIRGTPREHVDREGQVHRYEVNPVVGVAWAVIVGIVSSLFGVGGGLLLVPFLVVGYGMPTILSTSTAQFTFLFTALLGFAEAARRGQVTGRGLEVLVTLGLGVIVGAQIGVAVARRVGDRVIRLAISAVMVGVGVLLLLRD
jgi:uncharacterized membrane protein YfcA